MQRRPFIQRALGLGLACSSPLAFSAPPLSRITAMNLSLDTSLWTPFCFGRLMVLLPPGSSTGLRSTFRNQELKLREDITSMQQLQAEVRAKEQEFKNLSHKNFGSRYIRTSALDSKGVSVWGYEFDEIGLDGKSHFILSYNYFYSENPFRVWYLTYSFSHLAEAGHRQYQLKYSRELRPLADGEVPKEPGFVVKGGIVRTQEWRAEGASLGFSLPFFKNPIDPSTSLVSFGLDSIARGVDGKKLLDRLSPVQAALAAFSGTRVIRKGERSINGLRGEEYLYRENTKDGRWAAYAFLWEMPGKAENVYEPHIELLMSVKLPVTVQYPEPPFKTDEEALAFWDAVTGTLRLRPMQGRDGQAIAPDGTPPPTARVGEVCPKGGVWEAQLAATGPLHDWPQWVQLLQRAPSRLKEVAQGQSMPQMYVSVHPSEEQKNAVLNAAVTWRWVKADWRA